MPTEPQTGAFTRELVAAASGDDRAAAALFDHAYAELRSQARRFMRGERVGHTLQPTALVHEAYVQLIRQGPIAWQGRAHFFGMAALLMRRILVDHARRKNAARRGGGQPALSLDEGLGLSVDNPTDVLSLNDALTALEVTHPRPAEVVQLRFFGGLSMPEIAAVLEVSIRSVHRDWAIARARLRRALAGREAPA